MHFFKNEKNILNTIKYAPILFVLLLSIVITLIFIEQKNDTLQNEIKKIKKEYTDNNKQRVKDEVTRVYAAVKKEKENAEVQLKKELKNRVYEAHNMATTIFNQESKLMNKEHYHSDEHIFHTMKYVLDSIVYNEGRGYYFIFDDKGSVVSQPLNNSIEGNNFLEYQDAKGYEFVKNIVRTIENKTESYDSYYWYKGNNKKTTYKKLSFYKYFEPFNIAIGSGVYVDDFEKELQSRLLKKIREISFEKTGYIFVYDLEGTSLSHYQDELIGGNRINVKDEKGNYFIKDILDFAKMNENGFMTYFTTNKPYDKIKSREKISYIQLFEDWNWVIGSGFYLDKLNDVISGKEKMLKETTRNAIKHIGYISISITILLILLSFYISSIIANRFQKYKIDIQNEIYNTIEQEKLLVQQSKMATMGEMIGNIAHQWKQPLTVIGAANGLLKLNHQLKDFTDEEIIESMDSIDYSVQSLSTTINDFRNFFNPHKQVEMFNIKDAFQKVFKLIDSQFKHNSIEVIKNVKDVELKGLENELLQTLINILKNAKEALEQMPSSQRRLLFIDAIQKENQLIIKIKDNAHGIPEDIISKIFDSHFTTKEDSGGTGIGLYMSKQIIKNHMNGRIVVSNVEYEYETVQYKGAEFTITVSLNN